MGTCHRVRSISEAQEVLWWGKHSNPVSPATHIPFSWAFFILVLILKRGKSVTCYASLSYETARSFRPSSLALPSLHLLLPPQINNRSPWFYPQQVLNTGHWNEGVDDVTTWPGEWSCGPWSGQGIGSHPASPLSWPIFSSDPADLTGAQRSSQERSHVRWARVWWVSYLPQPSIPAPYPSFTVWWGSMLRTTRSPFWHDIKIKKGLQVKEALLLP